MGPCDPCIVHHVFHGDVFIGDVAAPNAAAKAAGHRHTVCEGTGVGLGLWLTHHHPADGSHARQRVDIVVVMAINATRVPLAAGVIDRAHRVERVVKCVKVVKRHQRGQLLFAKPMFWSDLSLVFDHQELAIPPEYQSPRPWLSAAVDTRLCGKVRVALFIPHSRLKQRFFFSRTQITAFGFAAPRPSYRRSISE